MDLTVKITPRVAARVTSRLRLASSVRSLSMSAMVSDALDHALISLEEIRMQLAVPAQGGWETGRLADIAAGAHPTAATRSDAATRWSKDEARTILDTCGTKALLPGLSDPETLEMASKLSGATAVPGHGQDHDIRHPVMTQDIIRHLPVRGDGTGDAFILRSRLSPVIWHTRRYKKLIRRRWSATLTISDSSAADDLDWDTPPTVPAAAALPVTAPVPDPATPTGQAARLRCHNNRLARAARPWDQNGERP